MITHSQKLLFMIIFNIILYVLVYSFVSKYLEHPNLRQAFSIQPLLVGGNPFTTSSIYALIHALEQKWGISFVMGGTNHLVKELKNEERKKIELWADATKHLVSLTGQGDYSLAIKVTCEPGTIVVSTTLTDVSICDAPAPSIHWARGGGEGGGY